jgi:hypothetical protein
MNDRTRTGLRALAAALALSAIAAAPAAAAPVSVTLRVEGSSQTIYEERVTTDGHVVTTPSGGTHKCDGTNGGAHPSPVPVATAALDDGSRTGAFTWDGTYNASFDDFLVSRIGPDSSTSSQFWAFLVNSQFSQTGGCQHRVGQNDEVLWAYDGFNKSSVLRLEGPASATTGQPVSLRVTDGQDGGAEPGARVGGATTGPDGRATVAFRDPGIYRLKAERDDAIRSNVLVLCVDPAGAPPCSSTDKAPPAVQLLFRGGYASDSSRSRTIVLSWQGDDRKEGSGVSSYGLDLREVASGAGRAQAGWRTLVDRTTLTTARFRAAAGGAYEFRLRATDRAGNRGEATSPRVVVPVDDRDRRLLRRSGGWRRLARKAAWGGTVLRSRFAGPSLRFRFRGTRLAVIGRRLPRGGRLRVTIDGRSRTVRVRGRGRFRQVLFTSRRLSPGLHTARVGAAAGRVEVDALAPVP